MRDPKVIVLPPYVDARDAEGKVFGDNLAVIAKFHHRVAQNEMARARKAERERFEETYRPDLALLRLQAS